MAFDPNLGGIAPYLILILCGFLPSEIWRWLSVLLARRIDEGSQIFVFAKTIASVLLVGVVGRLLLTPSGALAAVPLIARLGALLGAGCAYAILRRSVFAAVLVGEILIVAAAYFCAPV